MGRIISIHSFRGGTGKSNTAANVASLLAADGRRVALVDTDLQSPGIHVLFGLEQDSVTHTLNSFIWGTSEIVDTAHDVTDGVGRPVRGRVWLVPASMRPHDIARVMHDGVDVGLLSAGFRTLMAELSLDALILDTHPGLNEETLLSIAMSNALAVVMRPDAQDYEGTHVTVTVARKLKVPRMVLVVNKTPPRLDLDEVRVRVQQIYECPVAAVLPHSDELMELSSSGVFAGRCPTHPVTAAYGDVARELMA